MNSLSESMAAFFTDFACEVIHPDRNLRFRGILKTAPYQLEYNQTPFTGHDLVLVAATEAVQAVRRLDVLHIEPHYYRVLQEHAEGTGLSYFSLEKLDEN